MKIHITLLFQTAIAASLIFASGAWAGNVMKTETVHGLRIELHVLPAEPFFTDSEVAAKHITEGMLVMGGAAPVPPDARSRPNHHLVVHVYNAKTGKAVTDAKVEMIFQSLDKKAKTPADVPVPVVVMQVIGKGAPSTHYGNNVAMAPGPYAVTVTVNGNTARFKIAVTQSSGAMHTMNTH